ncbi:hypothetical protein FPV67DRAFT_1417027, partial [Lyophyllum atratum]
SELWDASSTEEEDFSNAAGADEDGKWEVNFVGEYVDALGEVRCVVSRSAASQRSPGRANHLLQAAWKEWTRADGSNITYDNNLLHPDDIKFWKRKQTARRNQLASESLDIDIWATLDVHNTATQLRLQAYDEKLRLRTRSPLNLKQKMQKLLAEKKGLTEEPRASTSSNTRSGRAFTRDSSVSTSASHAEGSRALRSSKQYGRSPSKAESRASSSTLVSKSAADTPSTSSSRIPKRSVTASGSEFYPSATSSFASVSSTASASSRGKKRAISTSSSRLHAYRRKKLELDWTARARGSGAASIRIINHVDDEEVPPLPPKFQYLESEYLYSNKVPRLDDEGIFVRCECDECSQAAWCGCQELSELVDEKQKKTFAYTSDGLFAFNVERGVEVIECNAYCQCDRRTCPNRVAQQPRDVPVAIFKTDDRGWGVQSPVDVERGKVLGIYTGRRDVAEALPDDEKSYCFDLDGREHSDAEAPEDLYSVDSRTCGNWTRFINHSCTPNLCIYLVVYDTIPEMNTPYIAFVAKVDIPAGTEFTVDYDPGAAEAPKAKGKGKGKGRPVIPEGAEPCRCGSVECRGWVRV